MCESSQPESFRSNEHEHHGQQLVGFVIVVLYELYNFEIPNNPLQSVCGSPRPIVNWKTHLDEWMCSDWYCFRETRISNTPQQRILLS